MASSNIKVKAHEGITVIRFSRVILTVLLVLTLLGCGTTRRFVDQPQLTVDGPDKTAHQAAAELFDGLTPYTVNLCEADPVSKECKQASDGIRANGVGGLFLPLALHWRGMTVSQQNPSDAGWAIDASIQSKVDAIPPLCRTAHGQILLRDNDTITLQLRNFYCNWVLVGNVLVNADLSIDHIDPRNKAFTGFYKITFHGTGNAAGSGYYRAVIVPVESAAAADDGRPSDGFSGGTE
jgi:hypothetical protein